MYKRIAPLFFLLSFFVFQSLAQEIRKGLVEIDGKVEAKYTKDNYFSTTNFAISPKYGRFITDHWLLGSGVNFGAGTISNKFSQSEKIVGLGVSPYAQYFINPKAKWAFFLKAESDIRTSKIAANAEHRGYQRSSLDYRAGFGVNRFLNKTLVFQTSLGVGNTLLLEDKTFTYIPKLVWSFNIKNLLSFQDMTAPEGGYLKKGRQIIKLDAEITHNFRKDLRRNTLTGEAEYGYFIKDKLLVGSKFGKTIDDNHLDVYGKYYIPLRKKTFANIQAGVGANSLFDHSNLTYNFSAGLSHFIAPDVMLDIELASYKHGGNVGMFRAGPSIGIKRFLK